MRIYLAGNITPPREKMIMSLKANRLYSYHYHGKGKEFEAEFKYRLEKRRAERK